ncbi:MAG: hypothetical protein HC835_11580 [Oscillatoriales cyanobacterium RM2_1_1]|nr:hypothetical protein [Oscillatoriales cyanobacterium SM2_3_0]NJO46215.1 hypothetical protein [Oscillatoriales cyanobacterium RM2_1_1]
MTTYRIRGRVGIASQSRDVIQDPLPDLWVESWDKDERFDDRFGRVKTDSNGVFEVQFTEAAFQQEPGEADYLPDIFFKVYRGRDFLFSTETRSIEIDDTLPGSIRIEIQDKVQWNWTRWPDDWENLPPLLDRTPLFSQNITITTQTIDDGTVIEATDTYRIEVLNAWIIPEPEDRELPTIVLPEEPWENQIIDVLPTLDQVERTGGSLSVRSADNSGGSLQTLVDNALNSVLCRSSKRDPQAFINSLTKAFVPKAINGHTTYTWTPCSYNTIQTDLGGTVSGAQASLYHRAKAALKEILPLLDKLYSLKPAADPQNMKSIRSIVRTEVVELVNELGNQGGPRNQRVESLFQLLIGNTTGDDPYEFVEGQLRELADIFGLTRSAVNTVEEEHNYGNYLIIRDYIVSLRGSWKTFSENSGAGAYVGSQLVLLSQALTVVAESVEETYQIMNLMFLGASERQSVWIDFTKTRVKTSNKGQALPAGYFPLPDGTLYKDGLQLKPPMTVEMLLSWVLRFATEEGPALARSGGKIGIAQSLRSTADRLMILVQAASFVPVQNTAYSRAGVTRALKDLAFQLHQVKRLAEELIPPITSDRLVDADDERDGRLITGGDSQTGDRVLTRSRGNNPLS